MEVLLLTWILCGVFSAMIASSKNRGGCGWFIAGFLFGPLALLAVIGMAPKAAAAEATGSQSPEPTKKCPKCAETIKAEAIKCRYCGSDLDPPPERPTARDPDVF